MTACSSAPSDAAERAAERQRLERGRHDRAAVVLHEHQDRRSRQRPVRRGRRRPRRPRPDPRRARRGATPAPAVTTAGPVACPPGSPTASCDVDHGLAGREPALHRRVAGEVDALLHADDGRAAGARRPPASRRSRAARARSASVTVRPLAPVTIGRPSARATRMPTWNPPESAASLPKRIRSNGPSAASSSPMARRSARAPCAAGSQSGPSIGSSTTVPTPSDAAYRSCSSASGGPRVSAVTAPPCASTSCEPGLERALLVRAHREPEVGGVDRLPVGGHVDAGPGRGHPLDADEDSHAGSLARRRRRADESSTAVRTRGPGRRR